VKKFVCLPTKGAGMEFYRFRPLADSKDEERAKQIVETGCFWCAEFMDLNDPMEGAFLISQEQNIDATINRIYEEKNNYKICSFSGSSGFENPSMWGYYANGFKGIVIGVEIKKELIKKVKYINKNLEINADTHIEDMLLQKLISWEHEDEYRYLMKSDNNYHQIGPITAVYFGDPYNGFSNRCELYHGSQSWREYEQRKVRLKQVAGSKDISVCSVEVSDGKVVKIRGQVQSC
jgi:hypothetical protein